ncbi:MAG TPA: energy-coupling factor transporter transmembrane component T [Candidatus Limnocylindrales bacterium]|jgi:energy-coupling factor transport system permease protein|nr:energy-coupling factor transporter transmembrane component T [Candidatus Limnocylindrales bacterium]
MTQSFRLYEPGSSFLYRLDPRVKVVGVLAVFLLSILFTSPYYLGPVFALIVAIIVAGRVPLRRVALLLRSLTILVLISLVLWPLLYRQGPIVTTVFGFPITEGGLEYGAGMTFRILDMVIAPITLFLTTTQPDFVAALRRLGLPYKASFALATSFRFLPTVAGVGTSIVEAQRARGLDPSRGSPVRRIRSYARILGPLVITCIRIAQQLTLAVEARAFSIDRPRTFYRQLRLRRQDRIALGVIGAACVVGIAIRLAGFGLVS